MNALKTNKYTFALLGLLTSVLISNYANAVANTQTFECEDDLCYYDANYFALVAAPNSDSVLADDNHAEFYLSLKYRLWHEYFFIYNGLYDFYFSPLDEDGRYDSSPIVSRLQNPGLIFWDKTVGEDHNFSGSFFHESNGQTLSAEDDDVEDSEAIALAEFNRLRTTKNKEFALAKLSRNWNYFNLRYQYRRPARTFNYFQINARIYIPQGREDELFWTQKDRNNEITDFDGLRFLAEFTPREKWTVRTSLKTGFLSKEIFRNVGGKVTVSKDIGDAWLSLFHFNGYGREPSTYHLRTYYTGLALEFRK